MSTRIRTTIDKSQQLCKFFLEPTEYPYTEFVDAFGCEIADEVFRGLYKSKKNQFPYRQLIPIKKLTFGNTSKYVFRVFDGHEIETVCIGRRTGITICISTQVGCSVRCRFCRSGEKGFFRNLTASEIVQQFLFVDEDVNRIVFMGIGEPLNNYDEVIKSIHILRDRKGVDFATDGITISTVGPIGKLLALREEHLKIQLALSLHATDQETRDYLVPGMSRYPINEVVSQGMEYGRRHNRKVAFAYLVLPGINDKNSDIMKLCQWFSRKNAIVNLMRFNGKAMKDIKIVTKTEMRRIKQILEASNVQVTVRDSMGESIEAACGQLIAK